MKAYTESEMISIVTSRNEAATLQIAQIRNNTKKQIEALKLKYAIPDAIKKTSGFIAIISLGTLAILVAFTDSLKYLFCRNKAEDDFVKPKNQKIKLVYVP
jgi:hypothetical protein